MKLVIRLTAVLLTIAAVGLQAQELRTDHPDEYVVQRGDTLWDISGRFLTDPWLWPEIWHVNEQVANPHLIYPGDRLRLVYVDGRPQIVVDRGVVKLGPAVRSLSHQDAISAIPLDDIDSFFSRTRVVSQGELDDAPYMVSGSEARLLVTAGDTVYARGTFQDNVRMYQIYPLSDKYIDPETEEVLGVRADAKGLARYQSTNGEITALGLEESYREISVGDLFLPLSQEVLDPEIFPTIPTMEIDGRIIYVEDGVQNAGQFDVVAINRGYEQGLSVGHLLGILQKGEVVRDRIAGDKVELPPEQAGLLMIIKTEERMSFGLILESLRPLSVGDSVSDEF